MPVCLYIVLSFAFSSPSFCAGLLDICNTVQNCNCTVTGYDTYWHYRAVPVSPDSCSNKTTGEHSFWHCTVALYQHGDLCTWIGAVFMSVLLLKRSRHEVGNLQRTCLFLRAWYSPWYPAKVSLSSCWIGLFNNVIQ